uniref:Uncharacterized protein n=1 Tax=Spironucleus salmonicida TaxID=348837 RepID=V6LPU4_9EUKA|eukprot:EST46263.1 Hypothetical protein SS50377_13740 [Spironucleus salmonicida]
MTSQRYSPHPSRPVDLSASPPGSAVEKVQIHERRTRQKQPKLSPTTVNHAPLSLQNTIFQSPFSSQEYMPGVRSAPTAQQKPLHVQAKVLPDLQTRVSDELPDPTSLVSDRAMAASGGLSNVGSFQFTDPYSCSCIFWMQKCMIQVNFKRPCSCSLHHSWTHRRNSPGRTAPV